MLEKVAACRANMLIVGRMRREGHTAQAVRGCRAEGGRWDEALGAMLTAERIAPEQVHRHYIARKVVMSLTRSVTGKPPAGLENLARRMKISELA